jgi:hypothetical protein
MKRTRTKWFAAIAGLFIAQAALNMGWLHPRWARDYAPKQAAIAEGLSPDQLLAAMAGFREMIAGILWVRADSFFETGNYDAILPIVRLVTWLDPNQIDVYATGMWHIGYNFTDEKQRSDRRYLPSALSLGMEGSKTNSNTYELFFETGWLWYHKIDDSYPNAVKWFEDAQKRKDMDLIPARKNVLGNAYLRNGQVQEALDFQFKLLDDAEARLKGDPGTFSNRQNRDTIQNNIETMLVRMSQRGWLAAQDPSKRTNTEFDTAPPFDVGFSVRATVVEPKVLQFEGTWNVLPVGTRIRLILRDADYPQAIPGSVEWDKLAVGVNLDPPRDRTYLQDQLYVKNRAFSLKVDMSRDPTMYPLTKEKYVLEFYYNPRQAPPHIQDKFSWNGEGFTDSNFLNTEARPGTRVMYTSFEVTRDQLLQIGEWQDRPAVFQTKNFVSKKSRNLSSETIQVPGILNQPSTPVEDTGRPQKAPVSTPTGRP